MNKQNWKQANRSQRRAVRRAVNMGIATDILQGRGFAMLASIKSEIAPELALIQAAENYATNGNKSLFENNPECYGQSVASQQRKYGAQYRVAPMGEGCDIELTETETALVNSANHIGNIEEPLH